MDKTMAFFALVLGKDFSSFCNRRLQEIGLTQGLLYFIIYVGKHPGCATGSLMKDLNMDWGHAQRSVERLVQEGFLHKWKNEQDKRACCLSLTPKGEHAFLIGHQVFFDWDAAVLERLTAAEKEQLFTILEKLKYRKGGCASVQNDSKSH